MDPDMWDLMATVDYIASRGYQRVALQFPDEHLDEAPLVAAALAQELAAVSTAQVYVLADTTYNPLNVDEVAAQHVTADCVIHYGPATLTPTTRIPALCVLPKAPLDVAAAAQLIAAALTDAAPAAAAAAAAASGAEDNGSVCPPAAVLLFDQRYSHAMPELQQALLVVYTGPMQLEFACTAPQRLDPPAGAAALPAGAAGAAAPAQGTCCAAQAPHLGGGCAADAAAATAAVATATPLSGGGGGMPAAAPAACCAIAAAASSCSSSAAAGQQPQAPASCCDTAGSGAPSSSSHCAAAAPTAGASSAALAGEGAAAAAAEPSSSGRAEGEPLAGLVWRWPERVERQRCCMVWLGPPQGPSLLALQLTHNACPWVLVDPEGGSVQQGLSSEVARLLKRRYFLVEKARGASIVGLLVGTLATAGYLEVLHQLRRLARQAGKHTYTLLMGRPNPAKLGNFPEVEVFVHVADPLSLILDSKEYLAPLMTPYEALLAFTGQDWDPAAYRLDFQPLLSSCPPASSPEEAATAGDTGAQQGEEGAAPGWQLATTPGMQLASKMAGLQVGSAGGGAGREAVVRNAAEYLQLRRSYQGLETPATGAEVKEAHAALPGRVGRAAVYTDEPSSQPAP